MRPALIFRVGRFLFGAEGLPGSESGTQEIKEATAPGGPSSGGQAAAALYQTGEITGLFPVAVALCATHRALVSTRSSRLVERPAGMLHRASLQKRPAISSSWYYQQRNGLRQKRPAFARPVLGDRETAACPPVEGRRVPILSLTPASRRISSPAWAAGGRRWWFRP